MTTLTADQARAAADQRAAIRAADPAAERALDALRTAELAAARAAAEAAGGALDSATDWPAETWRAEWRRHRLGPELGAAVERAWQVLRPLSARRRGVLPHRLAHATDAAVQGESADLLRVIAEIENGGR
jgi:hypothetical protein